MSAPIQPRDGATLDYLMVFDEGCVQTRRNELIRELMPKLEHEFREKLRAKHFKEQIKQGKPLPPPKQPIFSQGEKVERFGEKARKLADEIIEQERQNYVDARAERDKHLIVEIHRKLRFLVWTVDEDGKPIKLKVIVETVTEPDHRGDYHTHDIQYVGDHDRERLRQINSLTYRLGQLRPYFPYYSAEIKILYKETANLGTLEVVRKKVEKEAKKP